MIHRFWDMTYKGGRWFTASKGDEPFIVFSINTFELVSLGFRWVCEVAILGIGVRSVKWTKYT